MLAQARVCAQEDPVLLQAVQMAGGGLVLRGVQDMDPLLEDVEVADGGVMCGICGWGALTCQLLELCTSLP